MNRKKTILYYTGDTAEEWSPDSIKTGLAGSQTAVVYLSKIWQQMGYTVTVYSNIGKLEGIYEGITYIDFRKFKNEKKYDIAVLWREPSFLDHNIKADKIFLDLHDNQVAKEYTDERIKKVNKIFVKSDFQKKGINFIPNDKFVTISNGIDLNLYTSSSKIKKDRNRVIYASDYFRGLQYMLIHGWPLIKKKVPEAELDIYYGWNFFDCVSKNNPQRLKWKKEMIKLMDQSGVREHGRVGHKELIEKMQKANFLYYGCNVTEIDCINIRQAAYASCIPFTSEYGALKEKQYSVKVSGNFNHKTAQIRLANIIIHALKNNKLPKTHGNLNIDKLRIDFKNKASKESWNKIAEEWTKYF